MPVGEVVTAYGARPEGSAFEALDLCATAGGS